MKTLFIPAKAKFDLKELKNLENMPKKLGLVTTIQFLDELPKIKKHLEENGKQVEIGGQILGCDVKNAEKIKDKVDAFLYIGSGHFHPGALLDLGKDIYLQNGGKLELKKRKSMLAKFYASKEIGIIVSLKKGQKHMDWAEELKQRFKDKNFYMFVCDTLDYNQLENFPFIECWVNTACPRIADDIKVVNYEEIK
ncbi:2-(3-amino-3-carboxypropyl)histidine synthase subunit [Candidatus Woesearchaeota archaeon]|nr:2-(3-amino-3-carboxypropyl)histidine synthase subunit [Candidatus Woesearchaeota archaeon]